MKAFIVAAILVAVASADHHGAHSMPKVHDMDSAHMMADNPKMAYLHNKLMMIREKLNITYDTNRSFSFMDADMDGMLTETELVNTYMNNLDKDGDKMINMTEYVQALVMSGMPSDGALYFFFRGDNNTDDKLDEQELKMAFMGMDANHDKMVSYKEFKTAFAMILFDMGARAMLRPAVHKLFHGADSNDDHMIDMNDYKTMIMKSDKDMDGMVSKEEFVMGWAMATNETLKRSELFFSMLDVNMDGGIKEDDIKILFDGTDVYPVDGMLSEQEFMGSMTYWAAKMDEKIDMKLHKSFMEHDKDMNGGVDMNEVMEAMKMIDANGDGVMNITEWVMAGEKKGKSRMYSLFTFFRVESTYDTDITADEMKKHFNMSDFNGDGMIQMAEYSLQKKHSMKVLDGAAKLKPRMQMIFNMSDANQDGMVSGDELKGAIMTADKEGSNDGKISRDEFVSFWRKATGMGQRSSEIFFEMIDYKSKDGVFGDEDMKQFYANMDANQDQMGSEEEWLDFMLYYYSKISVQMDKEKMQTALTKMQMSNSDFDMQAAFNMVDKDMDGSVSSAEFDGLYSAMDVDMDGKINASEFVVGFMKTGMSSKGSLYIFFRMDSNEDRFVDKAEQEETFKGFDVDMDKMVSFAEYSGVMTKILGELAVAAGLEEKLVMVYGRLDADSNGQLTAAEMRALVPAMDKDGDGLVSEDEFAEYFVAATGADEAMSRMLFGHFDGDDDGFFGNDMELNALFTGFDYEMDSTVSEEEFMNSMLFLFARIQRDLEAASKMANAVVGFFF